MKAYKAEIVAVVIALLSLIVSGYASYSHNDKEISNRVTAVEVQQRNDTDGIKRVEGKVDRLLDWALGKH